MIKFLIIFNIFLIIFLIIKSNYSQNNYLLVSTCSNMTNPIHKEKIYEHASNTDYTPTPTPTETTKPPGWLNLDMNTIVICITIFIMISTIVWFFLSKSKKKKSKHKNKHSDINHENIQDMIDKLQKELNKKK